MLGLDLGFRAALTPEHVGKHLVLVLELHVWILINPGSSFILFFDVFKII